MDVVLDPSAEPEGPAVTVEAPADVTADVLLERAARWDAAVKDRDLAAADALLASDFALELVQPVRSVMGRDVWLEMLADYVVHEWEVEEQVVDQGEDVAALLQRVRMRATVMGEGRSGIFIVSDLWRLIDGEWRVWRRHSTPLSAGRIARQAP